MTFAASRLTFGQLVTLGVHVGHSYANSTLFSSWMLYGFRQGLCLIDLFKFVQMVRLGFGVINFAISRSRPIWFVNKDKAFARYISFYATKCGEFSSTLLWVRGMLSNYRAVTAAAKAQMLMATGAKGKRLLKRHALYSQWTLSRFTWPGLIFVSSVAANYFVVNEALAAQVPCLGITDTNAEAQGTTLAVPGNDDSLDCILFYHDLLAEHILYRKFVAIYLWFLNVRRQRRIVGFYDWLALRRQQGPPLHLGFFFSNNIASGRSAFGRFTLKVLFGQSAWVDVVHQELHVFHKTLGSAVPGLLRRHEAAMDRYYYFFQLFFFRRAFRSRGRFLLSRRSSRRRRRDHARRSSPSFLRRSRLAKAFTFGHLFRYVRRLYSLRRRPLGYRGHLFRFLHYYFFFYFFHFRSFHSLVRGAQRRLKRLQRKCLLKLFARSRLRIYNRLFHRLFKRLRTHNEQKDLRALFLWSPGRWRRLMLGPLFAFFYSLCQRWEPLWRSWALKGWSYRRKSFYLGRLVKTFFLRPALRQAYYGALLARPSGAVKTFEVVVWGRPWRGGSKNKKRTKGRALKGRPLEGSGEKTLSVVVRGRPLGVPRTEKIISVVVRGRPLDGSVKKTPIGVIVQGRLSATLGQVLVWGRPVGVSGKTTVISLEGQPRRQEPGPGQVMAKGYSYGYLARARLNLRPQGPGPAQPKASGRAPLQPKASGRAPLQPKASGRAPTSRPGLRAAIEVLTRFWLDKGPRPRGPKGPLRLEEALEVLLNNWDKVAFQRMAVGHGLRKAIESALGTATPRSRAPLGPLGTATPRSRAPLGPLGTAIPRSRAPLGPLGTAIPRSRGPRARAKSLPLVLALEGLRQSWPPRRPGLKRALRVLLRVCGQRSSGLWPRLWPRLETDLGSALQDAWAFYGREHRGLRFIGRLRSEILRVSLYGFFKPARLTFSAAASAATPRRYFRKRRRGSLQGASGGQPFKLRAFGYSLGFHQGLGRTFALGYMALGFGSQPLALGRGAYDFFLAGRPQYFFFKSFRGPQVSRSWSVYEPWLLNRLYL